MMSTGERSVSTRAVARTTALGVIFAALTALAVAVSSAAGESTEPRPSVAGMIDEDFAKNRVLGQLVAAGALVARPRPEVLREPPPLRRGILRFVPSGAPPEPMPSTALGADVAAAHPEREFVSLAIDPRDWDSPELGILTNATRRGEAWVRGATLSWFVDGVLRGESAVGLSVHGDSSRRAPRPSLRVRCTPRFDAQLAPSAVIPGASGSTFILHNDWRSKKRFSNPIGYEFLRHIGVDAPRTRPVRVLVNGELQRGIFFATEYLDDTLLAAKLGTDRLTSFETRNDEPPRDYRQVLLSLRDWSIERTATLDHRYDRDAVEGWVAGMLMLAPYDCLQGLAYRAHSDPCWRWVVYDVDWGLAPWPNQGSQPVTSAANIVDYLGSKQYDLRAIYFHRASSEPSELRRRLLARVRAALDHRATWPWWQSVLARYGGYTRRLLDPEERRLEVAALEQVSAFVRARPAALRGELADRFGLGAAHLLEVAVAEGASVRVDGHRYADAWRGYAFPGQRLLLETEPPFELQIGGDRQGGRLDLVVDGPVKVAVVRAR